MDNMFVGFGNVRKVEGGSEAFCIYIPLAATWLEYHRVHEICESGSHQVERMVMVKQIGRAHV